MSDAGEGNRGAESRPSRYGPSRAPTPWQTAAQCTRICLENARAELSEDAWPSFVEFLTVLAASEAGKLLMHELRREDGPE